MIDFDVLSITDVRHVRDHVLWLRFSDGVEGRVDLSDLLDGPAFKQLRDPEFFVQVRILYDYTIGWPNNIDLAPQGLYDRLEVTGTEPKRDYQKLKHEAPHFHAEYAEYLASIDIRDGTVTSRKFPTRALKLVNKWRKRHESELLDNWERLRQNQPPRRIPPLD